MKTLYISDLDGTLLQPNVELSTRTIAILNELIDQGMLFTVATARSIASVRTILKDVKVALPIVLMNGVCIYDLGSNEYINIEAFSKESKSSLLSMIKDHNLKGFAYTIKDGALATYYEDLNSEALRAFHDERVIKYGKKFTQIEAFPLLEEEPMIYFSLMDYQERLEPIYQLVTKLPELNCTLYKDNYTKDYWYLEIFSKHASKFHALQFLRTRLGLDKIVCFGDNRNDLPMFEASDYRLAVANAVPELKRNADEIIGSNSNNGVAAWLKRNYQ